MSQQQFEDFMAAQMAAMVESGLEPDAWVDAHAADFRAAWEASNV